MATYKQRFGASEFMDTVVESTALNGVQVQGRTSGVAIPSGQIGQRLNTSTALVTSVPVNTWTDVTSLALPAGIWDVTGYIVNQAFAIVGGSVGSSALSLFSGTTVTDQVLMDNQMSGPVPVANADNVNMTIPGWRVVTTGATVYLKTRMDASSGTTSARGRIIAVRVG
jgi:hypothetical protein